MRPLLLFALIALAACTSTTTPQGPLPGDRLRDGATIGGDDASPNDASEDAAEETPSDDASDATPPDDSPSE